MSNTYDKAALESLLRAKREAVIQQAVAATERARGQFEHWKARAVENQLAAITKARETVGLLQHLEFGPPAIEAGVYDPVRTIHVPSIGYAPMPVQPDAARLAELDRALAELSTMTGETIKLQGTSFTKLI